MNQTMQRLLLGLASGAAAAWTAQALLRQARRFSYQDKVVLVVGGSRGLGLVIARKLVDRGAHVAICARTDADLERAEDELRQRGGDVVAIHCDIRNRDEVQAMVEQVLRRWRRIDVLINVAGTIEVGPLEAMTIEDFHHAMDINCWGPLHTILAVLPAMRREGWGRIVNISSIGGQMAVPHLAPYSMSKHALAGLSTALRAELAKDNILVTTVYPGLMRTGSPRNALFKGKHRQEYAWFSIGDALPVVSMAASAAAEDILRGCQNGVAEVYTFNSRLPLLARELTPELTSELLMLTNRLLPGMGGIGQRMVRGYESQSSASPSWLTRLNEEAARRNNEMGEHPLSIE